MKSLKRPASIIVFSVIMFLSPLFTIFLNAVTNGFPLFGPGNIFSRMSVPDVLFLFFYLAAAAAIFSVTKTGWWVFIGSAVCIFVYNIAAALQDQMVSLIGVLVFNVFLFLSAGFFSRKHIIAPYFNPRLRWWEQASRYDINLGVSLECSDTYEIGYLEDISIGGCFIRISEDIKPGKTYPLKLSLGNELSVSVKGRIMRTVSDDCSLPGYGIMFSNLTDTEREGLSNMIGRLHSLGLGNNDTEKSDSNKRAYDRYVVNISISFRYKGEILPAKLINFSSTGACLETMMDMEMGEFCGFYCTLGYNSADVDGVIKWKRKLEHHRHYGIAFINQSKKQKSDIAQLLGTIKALGGKIRPRDQKEYEKLIDKTIPSTPYRIFYKTDQKE